MSSAAILAATLIAAVPNADNLSIERWPGPPWVEIGWVIDTPLDPETQSGLTAAAAEVLRIRAARITAFAHTVEVEARHGQIRLITGAPSPTLQELLPTATALIFRGPVSTADAETALARAQAKSKAASLDEVALAQNAVRAALFPDSPFARPGVGTLQGLAALTADDLSAFLHENVVSTRLHIGLAGAVAEDFAWDPPAMRPGQPRQLPTPAQPALGRRLVLVDKPGALRSVVAVGRWPSEPDRGPCAGRVRTAALGFGRQIWWQHAIEDNVDDAAEALLRAVDAPTSAACAEDRRAARAADRRRSLARWSARSSSMSNRARGSTTVIVVVTSVQAGLAADLSARLKTPQVAVVPYDAPSAP